MQIFTVGRAVVRALVLALSAMDLDVEPLLRSADLDPSRLEDPDKRFPEAQLLTLWTAAEGAFEGELLSLHAGSRIPLGALEVLDYLAGSGPTVGSGFRRWQSISPSPIPA